MTAGSDPIEPRPVLIAVGTPADGFEFIGPVLTNTEAAEAITADLDRFGSYWWYVPVESSAAYLRRATDLRTNVESAMVRDAEVRVSDRTEGTDDASDMYVLEALGVSVLVRQRADGYTYVHVESLESYQPLAVEINNNGETLIGEPSDASKEGN